MNLKPRKIQKNIQNQKTEKTKPEQKTQGNSTKIAKNKVTSQQNNGGSATNPNRIRRLIEVHC
jgi:hypothetical protein